VIIDGFNFTGVTAVRFGGGINAAFSVNSDGQISATVPAGAVSGPITVSKAGCPDAASASFNVNASPPVELAVDDGSFETAFGYGSGTPNAYFANRLTPPSYPATLSSVSLFFPGFSNLSKWLSGPIWTVTRTSTRLHCRSCP
jgi:hypothetical protein